MLVVIPNNVKLKRSTRIHIVNYYQGGIAINAISFWEPALNLTAHVASVKQYVDISVSLCSSQRLTPESSLAVGGA